MEQPHGCLSSRGLAASVRRCSEVRISDFGFRISTHPPEKKPQITQMNADKRRQNRALIGRAVLDDFGSQRTEVAIT